ncbi:hypothetical protein L596_029367 [Steinernema carpocapsae]|uniref:Uncharacterized protein n=1 Tax=Steinernema carpocapsae TaxID=34508 RepID=A0A4V5ZXN8_STECR|nr:hypothetical protein L596_029367 [Steinernema carpocapsae]
MLMTERRNVEAKSEMELKRMQKEMSSKDQVIEDLKETVDRLEKKLWEKGSSAQGPQNAPEAEQFETAPSTPVAAAPLPIRFRQSPPPPRLASRRTDVRFHSNPAIPVMRDPEIHGYTADEVRHSLAVPVRERLKFFEHIAEYQMSF